MDAPAPSRAIVITVIVLVSLALASLIVVSIFFLVKGRKRQAAKLKRHWISYPSTLTRDSSLRTNKSWGSLTLFRSDSTMSGKSSRSSWSYRADSFEKPRRVPIPSIVISDDEMALPIIYYTSPSPASAKWSQETKDAVENFTKAESAYDAIEIADEPDMRRDSAFFKSHKLNEMNAMEYFLEKTAQAQKERQSMVVGTNPKHRLSALSELQRQAEILQEEADFRPEAQDVPMDVTPESFNEKYIV